MDSSCPAGSITLLITIADVALAGTGYATVLLVTDGRATKDFLVIARVYHELPSVFVDYLGYRS